VVHVAVATSTSRDQVQQQVAAPPGGGKLTHTELNVLFSTAMKQDIFATPPHNAWFPGALNGTSIGSSVLVEHTGAHNTHMHSALRATCAKRPRPRKLTETQELNVLQTMMAVIVCFVVCWTPGSLAVVVQSLTVRSLRESPYPQCNARRPSSVLAKKR